MDGLARLEKIRGILWFRNEEEEEEDDDDSKQPPSKVFLSLDSLSYSNKELNLLIGQKSWKERSGGGGRLIISSGGVMSSSIGLNIAGGAFGPTCLIRTLPPFFPMIQLFVNKRFVVYRAMPRSQWGGCVAMKPVWGLCCVFVAVMRSVRDATVMDYCQLPVRTNQRADARQSPMRNVCANVYDVCWWYVPYGNVLITCKD